MIENYLRRHWSRSKLRRCQSLQNWHQCDSYNSAAAKRHYDEFEFSECATRNLAAYFHSRLILVAEKACGNLRRIPQAASSCGEILYDAAEALRIVAVLAHPVVPDATQKIWEQLGQSGKIENVSINDLQWGGLKPGTRIGKPEGVFPRADKKEILERIETMENEIRNPGSAQPQHPALTLHQPHR